MKRKDIKGFMRGKNRLMKVDEKCGTCENWAKLDGPATFCRWLKLLSEDSIEVGLKVARIVQGCSRVA